MGKSQASILPLPFFSQDPDSPIPAKYDMRCRAKQDGFHPAQVLTNLSCCLVGRLAHLWHIYASGPSKMIDSE